MTPMSRAVAPPSAMSPAAARIRAVLTHPLSMWVKRQLRSVAWLVKGAGLQNPALPARVQRVLFVCLGNICRSPFAALLAERLLADASQADITCESAGIQPSQAERPPALACMVAKTYGLTLDRHVPRQLTRELVASHDIVFVMEAAQLNWMRTAFPEIGGRLFLLSLYDEGACGAYERCNITDPFGQPVVAFEVCYVRVARALGVWVRALGDRT